MAESNTAIGIIGVIPVIGFWLCMLWYSIKHESE